MSYKGGDPGVVRVVDDHTLAFPSYNGNGMYLSMGNLLKNPSVGILFVDFEGRDRMRVNGDASIDFDDELDLVVARGAVRGARARPRDFSELPALRASLREGGAVRVRPREDCETPVPHWKREDWAVDVLPRAIPPSTRTDGGDVETLTVAAVQATPEFLDRDATVQKVVRLTKEAAGLGAK